MPESRHWFDTYFAGPAFAGMVSESWRYGIELSRRRSVQLDSFRGPNVGDLPDIYRRAAGSGTRNSPQAPCTISCPKKIGRESPRKRHDEWLLWAVFGGDSPLFESG
jgi:hypothetical protein